MKPMALVGRKHPALHRPADEVVDFERAAYLAARMMPTCRVKRGLALAAPQVGHSLRLVCTTTETFVNPRLISADGEHVAGHESCLTLPGRTYEVPRWTSVLIEATTLDEETAQFGVTDPLQARMWQHELDHLDGLLLSDAWPEVRHR